MNPLRGRGKPCTVDKNLIAEKLLSHRNGLLKSDGTIVTATNIVWSCVSEELNGLVKPTTLHSYVVNNRYGLKDRLLLPESEETSLVDQDSVNQTDSLIADTSADLTENFLISIPKLEFDALVTEALYSRNVKGKRKVRYQTILKQNEWTEMLSTHLWNSLRLKHAFHFKSHHLTRDATSGNIKGHCQCGSKIECKITNNDKDDITLIDCSITKGGDRECGKRQLRNAKRKKVAAELCHKSAEVYRTDTARLLMEEGDPEPPILYKSSVLRAAKHEYIAAQYLHADPIRALQIMKRSAIGRNVIHNISIDPFYVHVSSPHQRRLYNLYANDVSLIIDATSGVASKIEHVSGEMSHSIFLYIAVIKCPAGQFSVTQMLSEHQDTNTICNWLRETIKCGAKFPKQVICDSSRALLTACVWAFTSFRTIEEYCNGCREIGWSQTRIFIDVAHYIKLWADFLKSLNRRIKVFYLACIGQLILCRNTSSAEDLIAALLTISLSETDGKLINGTRDTKCEQHKTHLKELITGKTSEFLELCDEDLELGNNKTGEDKHAEEHDCDSDGATVNNGSSSIFWDAWAQNIKRRVEMNISSEMGEHENAHYHPTFARRLIKEIKHLPMWSGILDNRSEPNERANSSAPVEAEFKTIKQQVLGSERRYLRVDSLTEKIIKYYDGKLKILEANPDKNDEIQHSGDNVRDRNYSPVVGDANNLSSSIEVSDLLDDRLCISTSSQNKENVRPEIEISQDKPKKLKPTPLKEANENISCIACDNGDRPQGAHACVICKNPVHALPGCSVPFDDEEGHGQRRLCQACYKSDRIADQIAYTEIENHKGLAVKDLKATEAKRKKRARYLGKSQQQIRDVLSFASNTENLPILQNGKQMLLQLISINGGQYSFDNTCGFDSLFQVLLAAVHDYDFFKDYVLANTSENELFNLVIDTMQNKVRTHSYRLRASILLKLFDKRPEKNTIECINCAAVISDLVKTLFGNSPSFQESVVCSEGCRERVIKMETFGLKIDWLKDKEFSTIIERRVMLNKNRVCIECKHPVNVKLFIAPVVFFDVYVVTEKPSIAIGDIPKTFQDVDNVGRYQLIGIIDYSGPETSSHRNVLGHYTGICLRAGKKLAL